MKQTSVHNLAVLLTGEILKLMADREVPLLLDHGYKATEQELISLRLTAMDALTVATIAAVSKLLPLDAERMLQLHVKHVREGIKKVDAGWEEAGP